MYLANLKSTTISKDNETKTAAFQHSINSYAQTSSKALLLTAKIDIINKHGKTRQFRVVLDAGSQKKISLVLF